MLRQPSLAALLIALISLSACSANNNLQNSANPAPESSIETEANRQGVSILRDDQQETLPVEEAAVLKLGEGITVDEKGRATLRLADLLTAELFQAGEVSLQGLAADGESTAITLRQKGGTLLADFNAQGRAERQLTVETPFATVTTTSARFVLVSEPNSSLEWVINMGPASQDSAGRPAPASDVRIVAAGVTQTVPEGTARWVAPDGRLSERIVADSRRFQAWLNNAQSGETPLTLSEVLLSPANTIGKTEALSALPRQGQPFTLEENELGAVQLTLDPTGLFGNPAYLLEDCNGDGSRDIVIRAGKLKFDFRSMRARVLALDVTVMNRGLPEQGALWASDPAGVELSRELLEVGPNQSQTLSLRSNHPYHTAELAMSDGCFLGFSLTPPTSTGTPGEPRAAATVEPGDTVVNILAEPERDLSGRVQMEAIPVGPGLATTAIQIDGEPADWEALSRQSGLAWTQFDSVTYDKTCANRYPGAETATDLSGQVYFAYDEGNLYVAFRVEDDGYVGYSGDGENYFLGDSPQLSLDMDLQGDFGDSNLSADDWQVDFLPNVESPRVALWQLGSLTSRPFNEARVAAAATATGYFLEAALPWPSLGAAPQPGDRLGLAANINDNDTPGSNVQECIISSAPRREWNVPTSWGTLLLRLATQ